MPQFGRPTSDVTTGDWTPVPLYANIDESTASDTDFISANVSTNDFCEVALSAISDPSASNLHVVRYRYRKNASSGNSRSVQVALYQGSTQIAAGTTHTPTTTTWTAGTFTLNATQADSITDYADLRLRFIATGTVTGAGGNRRAPEISWAEFEAPSITTIDSVPRGVIGKNGNFEITAVEYHNVTGDIVSVTYQNPSTVNCMIVLRDNANNITATHQIYVPAGTGSTTVSSIPAGMKYAAEIEIRKGGAL